MKKFKPRMLNSAVLRKTRHRRALRFLSNFPGRCFRVCMSSYSYATSRDPLRLCCLGQMCNLLPPSAERMVDIRMARFPRQTWRTIGLREATGAAARRGPQSITCSGNEVEHTHFGFRPSLPQINDDPRGGWKSAVRYLQQYPKEYLV